MSAPRMAPFSPEELEEIKYQARDEDELYNGLVMLSPRWLSVTHEDAVNEQLQAAYGCAKTFQFELYSIPMKFTTFIVCLYADAVDEYVSGSSIRASVVPKSAIAGPLTLAELEKVNSDERLDNGICIVIPKDLLKGCYFAREQSINKELNEQLLQWFGVRGKWSFDIVKLSPLVDRSSMKDLTLVICLYDHEVNQVLKRSGMF